MLSDTWREARLIHLLSLRNERTTSLRLKSEQNPAHRVSQLQWKCTRRISFHLLMPLNLHAAHFNASSYEKRPLSLCLHPNRAGRLGGCRANGSRQLRAPHPLAFSPFLSALLLCAAQQHQAVIKKFPSLVQSGGFLLKICHGQVQRAH